jgi:hypothetical protein
MTEDNDDIFEHKEHTDDSDVDIDDI